jgi:hypothetical protein
MNLMGVQLATVADRAPAHIADSGSTRQKTRLRLKRVSSHQAVRTRVRALASAIGTGAASYVLLRMLEALYGSR